MEDKILVVAAHVLEVMFFTGLIGCVLMIVVNRGEIFSDGFTEDE